VGERLEGTLKTSRTSATKHLDEASGSITNNVAEGNGKRSRIDRCRFLDFVRGSALECAACLDTLVAESGWVLVKPMKASGFWSVSYRCFGA
jgi:four helix bundle protein